MTGCRNVFCLNIRISLTVYFHSSGICFHASLSASRVLCSLVCYGTILLQICPTGRANSSSYARGVIFRPRKRRFLILSIELRNCFGLGLTANGTGVGLYSLTSIGRRGCDLSFIPRMVFSLSDFLGLGVCVILTVQSNRCSIGANAFLSTSCFCCYLAANLAVGSLSVVASLARYACSAGSLIIRPLKLRFAVSVTGCRNRFSLSCSAFSTSVGLYTILCTSRLSRNLALIPRMGFGLWSLYSLCICICLSSDSNRSSIDCFTSMRTSSWLRYLTGNIAVLIIIIPTG